ncbi:hypothetical protein SAMN05444266_108321 [Chitinophaga jiangningensis]|uniref:Uncharacterized protein n=1 Tax=Chitinophaga jiangningensis TaxID=1419482 RepID=A0A1M7JDF2_9BACT|nr:hypothetical protein SAMN05444266_108321 [Chitinophaga jiangningensis]
MMFCVFNLYNKGLIGNKFLLVLNRFSKVFRTFVPFTSSFKPLQNKLFRKDTKSDTLAYKSSKSGAN